MEWLYGLNSQLAGRHYMGQMSVQHSSRDIHCLL